MCYESLAEACLSITADPNSKCSPKVSPRTRRHRTERGCEGNPGMSTAGKNCRRQSREGLCAASGPEQPALRAVLATTSGAGFGDGFSATFSHMSIPNLQVIATQCKQQVSPFGVQNQADSEKIKLFQHENFREGCSDDRSEKEGCISTIPLV